MEHDAATVRELAGFFAKRFPSSRDRARLASRAGIAVEDTDTGLDGVAAWVELIGRAGHRGALGRLAEAARAEAPGDANLRELCGILEGGRRRRGAVAAMLALGGALVVGAVVVLAARTWMGAEPTAPDPVAPAAPEEARPPEPAAVVEPTEPAVREPEPATPESPSEAVASAPRRTGCEGTPGEAVGWWYAGTTDVGRKGDTWRLVSGANVRADYPRSENRHNSRTALRCTLPAGTLVRLSADPVPVHGGRWWVPLHGGDILGP